MMKKHFRVGNAIATFCMVGLLLWYWRIPSINFQSYAGCTSGASPSSRSRFGCSTLQKWSDSSSYRSTERRPRMGKVTMLFGELEDTYTRAVATHERHAERHGYSMLVLRRQIDVRATAEGYWGKLLYMQSILVREMAKPAEERLEWLV